jgi:Protein of unknown function (DUF1549)/Protein of unknown function (DUF1553)/Planctomycete cytochrome C
VIEFGQLMPKPPTSVAVNVLLWACIAYGQAAPDGSEFFEKKIRPLLASKCYVCHGEKIASSALRLDFKAGWERGGNRGTAIVPGDPDGSLLIKAISFRDPQLKMPPGGRLSAAEIADLSEWVRLGAPDPRAAPAGKPKGSGEIDFAEARKFWAFQPIRHSSPPAVKNRSWGRSPIDALVLAQLEAKGLTPALPADKATLLRRVTFDLIGLPPTREEIAAFLADKSPQAYEKVVDRLLASPHYGERWGRHWLDLVRFAETSGHEFDFEKQEAWRYRDYVIRAFNQDLPYDQFVKEQIAGDLLVSQRVTPDGKQLDTPVATGLFGLGEERNGATDLGEVRAEKMDSRIDVFGKTFLGLTVACARCHDHKFDPIPTTDYYSLGGVFESTQLVLASIQSPSQNKEAEAILRRAAKTNEGKPTYHERPGDIVFEDFRKPSFEGWHVSGLAFAAGPIGGMANSFRGGSDKLMGTLTSRSFVPTKQYIHVRLAGTKFSPVREHPSLLAVTIFANGRYPKGVAGDGDGALRWKTISLHEEIGQLCNLEIADRRTDGHIIVDRIVFSDSKQPPSDAPESIVVDALPPADQQALPVEPFGMLAADDEPHNLRIHLRGNHLNLGDEVPRGFLHVLAADRPRSYSNGSGRLELAEALFNPDNPLTARVMVNRIWQHHFGEGLVRTVDNFGKMGDRPSHPELLDYLAWRFRESGWSVKAMHREMVLSNVYRLSSIPSERSREVDPNNRLLSHMRVKRLEGETIRDAILAASGSLDLTTYGPSVRPHISAYQDGRGKPDSGPVDGGGRRSVYLEVRRNFITPLFLAFDYPLPSSTVGRRSVSTVPSQALMLMNNEFVASEASRWAARVLSENKNVRLDNMFLRAYGRLPDSTDRAQIAEFLGQQAARYAGAIAEDPRVWADLAHVIFNSKEFIFVR